MQSTQLFVMLGALLVMGLLAFSMHRSIQKHNATKMAVKKKKGRTRYMPEVKNPGR